MRIKHIIFSLLLSCSFLCVPQLTSGQVDIGLDYGRQTGLGSADPRLTAAGVIRTGLGILGIVTTVILMYAGFKWMTAGGNEDEVATAKKMITAAVIGLVIIMSSYAITTFIISSLYKSTAGIDLNL